jgi:hypothetical protein
LHRDELLSSLRLHDLDERYEAVFRDSNIVLNIDDALHSAYYTSLSPETLFTYNDAGRLTAGSLYWQDDMYAVREIGAKGDDVVGIGGPASTALDISFICGITLTHPKEVELVDRRQYLFQHPSCPAVSPLLPVLYTREGGWVLGWDFTGNEPRCSRWHV